MASLGHAAYFGVGAYAVGLLAIKLHWSVWSALPADQMVVALVAACSACWHFGPEAATS